MQISNNMAVSFHYTLTNDQGEVLDSSVDGEALVYLHGMGNIIFGLEKAMADKVVGDKFKVRVDPEEAYGEYVEDKIQVLPMSMFEGVETVEEGMTFHADMGDGNGTVTVINVNGDDVTIDGNHPLAGEALTFDVEVIAIRPASEEEISHGHIHGDGGHHH
ncbi:MAG: peptidylprolyl isomerase [Methylococcaceae bacterium]|jgi:FKBP-type peptidyl-prolyl cis-trans isomerase SlyD